MGSFMRVRRSVETLHTIQYFYIYLILDIARVRMKLPHVLVILSSVFSLVALDEVEDKEAKAVVLEAEPTPKSSGPQTKLFTSDPTLNSAIAGVGIGVVGSLIVGALLDAKKQPCHPRFRRDTPSARFLGGPKCPPVGYHHPPPPVPYPNAGYPVPHPNTGYNPNYPKPGYPAPTYHNVPSSAYRPNNGYRPNNSYRPNNGYNNNNGYSSSSSYNTPRPNYSSASNYRPSNTGYNSGVAVGGYQQQNFAPSNYPPTPIYNQNNGE